MNPTFENFQNFETDDIASVSTNEKIHIRNFVDLPKYKESWSNTNCNESENLSEVIYDCLHSQSNVPKSDNNKKSREMANTYTQTLKNNKE